MRNPSASPAALAAGANTRRRKFAGRSGPPSEAENTEPSEAVKPSSMWWASIVRRNVGSATVRVAPVLVGPTARWPPTSDAVLEIVTRPREVEVRHLQRARLSAVGPIPLPTTPGNIKMSCGE